MLASAVNRARRTRTPDPAFDQPLRRSPVGHFPRVCEASRRSAPVHASLASPPSTTPSTGTTRSGATTADIPRGDLVERDDLHAVAHPRRCRARRAVQQRAQVARRPALRRRVQRAARRQHDRDSAPARYYSRPACPVPATEGERGRRPPAVPQRRDDPRRRGRHRHRRRRPPRRVSATATTPAHHAADPGNSRAEVDRQRAGFNPTPASGGSPPPIPSPRADPTGRGPAALGAPARPDPAANSTAGREHARRAPTRRWRRILRSRASSLRGRDGRARGGLPALRRVRPRRRRRCTSGSPSR